MNISEKIKSYRKEKNITQKKLADELNISFQSVSKWENGVAEPSLECIVKMANLFGVSLDEFLTDGKKISQKGATDKLFRQLSNGKISIDEAYKLIDNYFRLNLSEPTNDPTWVQGARRMLKATMAYLINHKQKVDIQSIRKTLELNFVEKNRQENLIKLFESEPEEIKMNVVQCLDTPVNTFKSYLTVLINELEIMEKI